MKGLVSVIVGMGIWLGGSGAALARNNSAALRLADVLELEKATTEAVALAVVQMMGEFAEWREHGDILLDYAQERLGWDSLRPLVAAWYAETFTEKELEELIRFHSTPTGRKWVALTPGLALQMGEWTRERFMADLDVLEMRMKNRALERLMEQSVFFDGPPAGREPGE